MIRNALAVRRLISASLAVPVAVTLARPASAQDRQKPAGRVGSGTVVRIFETDRFHRCAAGFLASNRNMPRIAFEVGRKYSPGVNAAVSVPINLTVTRVVVAASTWWAPPGATGPGPSYPAVSSRP